MGSSKGSSSTQTSQKSQSEPWAPAIPYLKNFLGDLDSSRGLLGPSGDQLDAFAQLKQNAAQGNPFTDQIRRLAGDQFGLQSRSGTVDDAYGRLQTQLGDIAGGRNQDILSDPRLQAMLKQVGDEAQNRVQGIFAGSGRDVTGNAAGQQAIGRGVTAAQLPILMNEYARQQGRTDSAIRDLFSGGQTAATTGQQLDTSALQGRTGGIDTAAKALQAGNYSQEAILNLDQQLKNLPMQDLGLLASLLLPVAGLGGQQQGTGTSNTESSGSSATLGGLGSAIAGIGSLFSDERVKEDITEVGETKDGQKVYRYRYKGDPTWHMGLIAQEVEKNHPEAVGAVGGIKTVEYGAATEQAAHMKKMKRKG